MKDVTKVDELLLGKFLAGEASPKEAILINDWANESSENEELLTQTATAWSANSDDTHRLPYKGEIWKSLEKLKNKNPVKSRFFTLYRMAGIVLLLIVAGVSTYNMFFSSPKKEPWISKKSEGLVTNITLHEGSSIVLNRNSQISYPSQFHQETRPVQLVGEAFFDIAHDPSRPFIISMSDINIEVLGTAFNVETLKNPDRIETQVTRGKVAMFSNDQRVIIEAGWIGAYDLATQKLSLVKPSNENNFAYATKTFSYENVPLEVVSKDLSKAYGVSFVFENPNIQGCLLTSYYQDKPLSFILEIISASLNISCELKNDIVHVSGSGCL